MSQATIEQVVHAFFRSPTVDRYLTARFAIIETEAYEPGAREVVDLESLLASGQPLSPADVERVDDAFQLCPRFHYVTARIAERLRQKDAVRIAVQRMQLCLRAISETGDGTVESPFLVTFRTDSDDIVRAFGESTRSQRLTVGESGYCDVLTTLSGDEFWFDVDELLERTSADAGIPTLPLVGDRPASL